MKRILLALVLLLAVSVSASAGGFGREIITVTATATNAATLVSDGVSINGEILQVWVDLTTATNVDVTVSIDPELVTMDDIVLYTDDDVDADQILLPRRDGTDAAGAALADDPPWPLASIGDSVKLTCENFDAVDKIVKAVIIYRKQ